MTTLDQMAKAAYEAAEAREIPWEHLPARVQAYWRAAIRAALEIRDAQWLAAVGPNARAQDLVALLAEVKPDAVTREVPNG